MAQVVYYVTATDHLRGDVNFCVPTGNFGNVFAGWIAKQMGAPIGRLVVASNANDILTRFFNDNDMSDTPRACRRSARRWTSRCRRTSSGCCSR